MDLVEFAEKHPELTGLILTAVVWPMLSAGFNYLFRPVSEEEGRMLDLTRPRWAGVLRMTRGLGLDPAKFVDGAKQAITGRLKAAPAPEVKP